MIIDKQQMDLAVIEYLSTDFQAIWLIDLEDMKLTSYKVNPDLAIPGSVDTASSLSNYELARKWYVSNFVVEEHKERVDKCSEVSNILKEISTGKTYTVDYRRICKGKVNYNQLVYAKVNREPDRVTHFLMGFRDVDAFKRADIDELTGLFTRKAFIQHAAEVLQKYPDERFDLMLSDIEDFKDINETYGMKTGDEILRRLAKRLTRIMRPDLLVGRYGGDQFAVLIRNADLEEALLEEGERSLDIIPEGFMPDLVVKYGICRNVSHTDPITIACDHAHIALNAIKHKYGQNLAVYDGAIKNEIERQRVLEKDMHAALTNQEFKVYYQPKHDANTGKVVGAEALIRWEHPKYGFLSPGAFIPLFEQNGFISEADFYVYRRTCDNLVRWKEKGLDLIPISVNASKLTFDKRNIVAEVEHMLESKGLPTDCLHIEITESLMSENMEGLVQKLNDLKEKRLQIELDDFGAGYSSINMLSTLPLDVIKLDMSFMQQFGDPKRGKILEACVKLARSLGYKTVSEGVETKEQLDALKELGVDIIQGYYFSKPLPEEQFEEYLRRHS